jgi:hypothetical protein
VDGILTWHANRASNGPMGSTAIQVTATRLRDAFASGSDEGRAVLASLYDDKVDIRHVPPTDHDGPMNRDQLVEVGGLEANVYKVAAPDLRSETTVEVLDDTTVGIGRRSRGTVEGHTVDFPMRMVLTVEGGKVTGMTTHIEPEMTAAMALIFGAPAAAAALQELMAAAASIGAAPTDPA